MRTRTLFLLMATTTNAVAQDPGRLKKLSNADIAGAPRLGQPTLLRGDTAPLEGGMHGLASPAVYDWDGDGKKDLLIGEFETGECWVRVYKNKGTNKQPQFGDDFTYAETGRGERLKIDSW